MRGSSYLKPGYVTLTTPKFAWSASPVPGPKREWTASPVPAPKWAWTASPVPAFKQAWSTFLPTGSLFLGTCQLCTTTAKASVL
ncbi:hypothetical protein H671_5g13996 [Cricetulus griseus]|nr:hypothetical protein H671_5g13996 [Cricetulus griseus]